MTLGENDAPTSSSFEKYTRRYNTIVCKKCGKEYKYRHKCEYTCECGRSFTNYQAYVGHCGHCKTHLGYDPKDRFGESRSWAKGKTKDTDERIKRMSERQKDNPTRSFLGRRHTEETRKKMSDSAKITASEHRNGWKAGDNRIPNKYEQFAEKFLIERGIQFQKEYVLPHAKVGNQSGHYYQLDFLVDGSIDLEIDGSAHNADHDTIRDQYISKLYTIHRINHNDSIEQLEAGLKSFISNLRS